MAIGLFSQDMIDEVMQRQVNDPEFRARLKGLNFSLILASTDAPGNEDRQLEIHIENGSFTSVTGLYRPAPSEEIRDMSFDKERFEAKVLGDHQVLFDFVSGKIDAVGVIQKVKIEGDFGKFMNPRS